MVKQFYLCEMSSFRPGLVLLFVLSVIMTISSCSSDKKQDNTAAVGSYRITPVDLRDVKLTDGFWLPVVQRIQEKTIPYALKKCEDEGRLDNFLIAGGEMEGSVKGKMPFDDTVQFIIGADRFRREVRL